MCWFSRIWPRRRRENETLRAMLAKPRDPDVELAELAALVESGDISPEGLERIAKLLGQSDS